MKKQNEDVFGWATCFLREYQDAKLIARLPTSSLNSGGLILWCAPLEGIYKINTDATIQDMSHQNRIESIVRDSKCQCIIRLRLRKLRLF
ncbi:hypothetical protein Ddye_025414 [Dipteronia dyeriana]|uniref:Uncharacterized protein n=1 Tax=Dipteronia dyeriana TaxID=168575 RepID=A0AAD9WN74_9ROSI|nr:hypothetical protein Ddye_025414 [Dipteronia dyeriana]